MGLDEQNEKLLKISNSSFCYKFHFYFSEKLDIALLGGILFLRRVHNTKANTDIKKPNMSSISINTPDINSTDIGDERIGR